MKRIILLTCMLLVMSSIIMLRGDAIYPCEGTGGHTEYALIWNETWCAEASWKGYEDDWMNISFNKTVILMPYETYNIMMKTGSYPQIHHTNELETDVGKIRCVEFVDVNGRRYKDWIPAFKLYE